MSGDTPADRFRENATSIVSTLVTGIWLAALFTGQDWWLAALLLGYVVVVPLVALLYGDESDRAEWWDEDDEESAWWGDLEDWFGTGRRGERSDEGSVGGVAEEGGAPAPPAETPLETLRRRYAAGELTDAQFERKLERLLETDTLENVEERAAREERDRLREREGERG